VEKTRLPRENQRPVASHIKLYRVHIAMNDVVIFIQQNPCMNVKVYCHFELKQIQTCFYCLVCLYIFAYWVSIGFCHWLFFFFWSVGFTTRVIHILLWFYCWHYIMYWRKNNARGLIFFFYFQFDTIFVRDSSTRTCIKNNVAHERTSKNLSCQHELDHICTIVVTPTISVT
jgi:hypothetical protein